MPRLIPRLVGLSLFLLHVNVVSSASTYEHAALQAADQCDWIGSGGGGRGVRPVYLRCSRGTVFWRYPHGALRVVLSPPALSKVLTKIHWDLGKEGDREGASNGTAANRDNPVFRLSGFRTCTKVSGPVRVYLETRGKLRPLYSPRDGKHEASHRCFHAKKPPAALYIEAEEPVSGEGRDAKLQYDLEVRYVDDREGKACRLNDDEEEEEDCRPCSMDELAKAYCQSDLVARGTVSAVQRQPNLEAAELLLGITKTLRRVEENEGNEVDGNDSSDRRNVRVRVPTACDARHGQGEFVVMAKRRLGDLVLVCAPRLETWAKTVRELETAPCVLRS